MNDLRNSKQYAYMYELQYKNNVNVNNKIINNFKTLPFRCKIPFLENDTYAVQDTSHFDLINQTIPLLEEGGYDACHVIQNGTKRKCSEWVFDQTVFVNTATSQVCKN